MTSRVNVSNFNGQPPCRPSPTISVTSLCLTILSPRTQPQPHPQHDPLKNCTSISTSLTKGKQPQHLELRALATRIPDPRRYFKSEVNAAVNVNVERGVVTSPSSSLSSTTMTGATRAL
ncbi:hypothetical protein CVT25_008850 [Psilocybe cyanescens]|uniref:Uncharacterized protein n=1 Tax=Psilocybe cyanescens TaxID=93625 RepID=A0A409XAR0_PSICY|nr:hypothetical protein CVT25_008850 [Psilocybe cyanescens]